MGQFTFMYNNGDSHSVQVQFEEECWPEVVMRFEEFLRGCGYVFKEPCHLEMVDD